MNSREQLQFAAKSLYRIIGDSALHIATCTGCQVTEELSCEVSDLAVVAEDLLMAGLALHGTAVVVEVPDQIKPYLIQLFKELKLPVVVAIIEHVQPGGGGHMTLEDSTEPEAQPTVHLRKPIEA